MVEERGYVPPERGGLNVHVHDPRPTPPPVPVREPSTSEIIESENVFEKLSTEEWDYEAEVASRSPDVPYVIHQDEYSDQGFTGVTLTYYEADNILVDDDNKPVDNKERLVGNALARFGHGSRNPHIVYVRNETLSIDVEVVKDSGSYADKLRNET
jgi:hypothetical protein